MTAIRRISTALLGLLMLAGAGCSRVGENVPKRTELIIVSSRDMGFGALLQQYMKMHPEITVRETRGVAASGDIAVIDDYTAAGLAGQKDDYVDLGAGEHRWGGWAVPVGVDGLAMCYQRRLFSAAGLPEERKAVAALWPTWDAYVSTGQRFEAAKLPAHWVDSALSVFTAVLSQQQHAYHDAGGRLMVSRSPAVEQAWRVATGVSAVGESAQLGQLTPQWVAAAQSGRFATLPCTSWTMGWLERNVPDLRGDWDVAAAPSGLGPVSARYLVVPAAGDHVYQAQQLAMWLAAPAQQITAFTLNGMLPSSRQQHADPDVRDHRNSFLNDAPTGKLLISSIDGRKPQPVGERAAEVRSAVERLVTRVDGWEISAADGWAALAEIYPS